MGSLVVFLIWGKFIPTVDTLGQAQAGQNFLPQFMVYLHCRSKNRIQNPLVYEKRKKVAINISTINTSHLE